MIKGAVYASGDQLSLMTITSVATPTFRMRSNKVRTTLISKGALNGVTGDIIGLGYGGLITIKENEKDTDEITNRIKLSVQVGYWQIRLQNPTLIKERFSCQPDVLLPINQYPHLISPSSLAHPPVHSSHMFRTRSRFGNVFSHNLHQHPMHLAPHNCSPFVILFR